MVTLQIKENNHRMHHLQPKSTCHSQISTLSCHVYQGEDTVRQVHLYCKEVLRNLQSWPCVSEHNYKHSNLHKQLN